MSKYSDEISTLIKDKKITYENEFIVLDDDYITKKDLIKKLKKIIEDDKEDFNEYKKQTQKSKNRNRKK